MTEKEAQKEARIIDVPTQTAPAFELEDGKIVSSMELQLIDHNLLMKIARAIA